MEKCVVYARVSTIEQEREGYSIDDQLRTIRDYIAKNRLKCVQEFPAAESAKRSGRRGFNQMLDFLDANTDVKHLVCDRFDRLSRNLWDLATIDDRVSQGKLTVHFASEGIKFDENSTVSEKMMYGMMGVFSKGYSDGLSFVVKKNMREKAAQGHFPGRTPMGYRHDRNTRKVEYHPSYAHIVQKMFERYATGRYSLKTIANMVFTMGLTRRPSGKPLSEGSVERILKNPFYYGEFRWEGKLWTGSYEPLISRDLFDDVQKQLNRLDKSKQRRLVFPYRGLLKCGYCGCNITAQQQKQKYVYYNCTEGKGRCPQKYFRESEIAARLGELVRAVTIDSRMALTIGEILTQGHAAEREHHGKAVTTLKRELTKLQNRLVTVEERCYDKKITEQVWQTLSENYGRRMEQLQESLRQHEEKYNRQFLNVDGVLELAQTAYSQYEEQTDEERRLLLDNLVSKVVIKGDEFIPEYRQPFDFLAVYLSVAQLKKEETGVFLPVS